MRFKSSPVILMISQVGGDWLNIYDPQFSKQGGSICPVGSLWRLNALVQKKHLASVTAFGECQQRP